MMWRVQALFDAAAQQTAAKRRDYVLKSSESMEVRDEVLRLLEHAAHANTFLERSAVETYPALLDSVSRDLAEFRIIRELGRGGMGVVYLAEDTVLDRPVALKVLGPHLTGSDQAHARFRREAQAVARLTHPAIIPIYRYGEGGGTHFLAMRYVEGETLYHRLQALRASSEVYSPSLSQLSGGSAGKPHFGETSNPDYIRNAARVTRALSLGLDYAHGAGVLHRDVKPSNILIDLQGEPFLTDFGIAKLDATDGMTRTGDLPGTFQYMSPEQMAAQPLDRRTDIFSLGVVLYEMLALRPPFRGAGVQAVAEALKAGEPTRLRSVNPAVPRDLETICHKAMERQPAHRYPTAGHMAADLECFLRGDSIMAKPPALSRRLAGWLRRHRPQTLSAVIGLLITLLAAATGAQLQAHRRSTGSISVDINPAGHRALVLAQAWDHATASHAEPQLLGPAPVAEQYLQPGSYRVTVVDEDKQFVQFDAIVAPATALKWLVSIPAQSKIVADMVEFPQGNYTVRILDWESVREDETVWLEGFWLDRFEVSNAQYLNFVQATGHPRPEHWDLFGYDEALADRPVVGVSIADAEAYALWCGKRLPTAIEWEAAARWPDARLYPWGAHEDTPEHFLPTYDALVATQSDVLTVEYAEYVAHSGAVTADPTPQAVTGLGHLMGNVLELTSSLTSQDSNILVVKGGYWASHPDHVDLRRGLLYPRSKSSLILGFRCARSAAAPGQQ